MREVQTITLVSITMAAVLADLRAGKIPNGVIATGMLCGLAYQIFAHRGAGILLFAGGALLPPLLLGILYYFHMIGAGDIKLLGMAGGFMGPVGCFSCMTAAVFAGGVISFWIMVRRQSFCSRMEVLAAYVREYSGTGQPKNYLAGAGEEDRFCFSVPILLGVLIYIVI